LKSYSVTEVRGDGFAGGFADEWARHGIRYIQSEYSTSENYSRLLPMLLAKTARPVALHELQHHVST